MPIAPLVANTDTDLANWQAGQQEVFLAMVCAEVRKYCGWHIAPAVPVTGKRFWIGAGGLVMLRSRHVTEIDAVTIQGTPLVADTDYTWDKPLGWLRLHPYTLSAPAFPSFERFVNVDMVHGYDETPLDVKAVIFEIVATAMELPASNATEFTTMQYNMKLNSDIGVMLSKDQKERLSGYKVNTFGGLVRAVSTIPTPITVYHQVWTVADDNDAHGNPVEYLAPPVPRKIQVITEFGRRGSSHEIVDVDYLLRVESLLEMGVPDVSLYNPKDEIIIGATGLDENGCPIGGVAFHVEGVPSNNKLGPLPLLNNLLGGAVRVRRVT